MSWNVIYTKSRSEKKVEERLKNIGIEAYCPLRTEVKFWSDRKKSILVPVLPSMVLVKIEKNKRNQVFEVPGVVRYMFWLKKHAVVRDDEVDSLKLLLKSNNIIEQNVASYDVGDEIKISSLKDQLGIIKKISKNQIWVVLKQLGYVIKLKTA
ncbi:UpxY family transcription antiterminator [Flavobacteriaceae bacterium]|nr:UpxY family transcription antiterminator [Flavobacteriaceae bacterium]